VRFNRVSTVVHHSLPAPRFGTHSNCARKRPPWKIGCTSPAARTPTGSPDYSPGLARARTLWRQLRRPSWCLERGGAGLRRESAIGGLPSVLHWREYARAALKQFGRKARLQQREWRRRLTGCWGQYAIRRVGLAAMARLLRNCHCRCCSVGRPARNWRQACVAGLSSRLSAARKRIARLDPLQNTRSHWLKTVLRELQAFDRFPESAARGNHGVASMLMASVSW